MKQTNITLSIGRLGIISTVLGLLYIAYCTDNRYFAIACSFVSGLLITGLFISIGAELIRKHQEVERKMMEDKKEY